MLLYYLFMICVGYAKIFLNEASLPKNTMYLYSFKLIGLDIFYHTQYFPFILEIFFDYFYINKLLYYIYIESLVQRFILLNKWYGPLSIISQYPNTYA